MNELTAERLRELLHYDPQTGVLTRRISNSPRCKVGDIAGSLHRLGYIEVMVDARNYRAHRICWFHACGVWPSGDIDHVNGIKSDNRFRNLRDVTESINMQNEKRARLNNRSGLMGAVFRKDRQRWTATVRINGKPRRFGSFATAREAHEAYLIAKRLHHPGFNL